MDASDTGIGAVLSQQEDTGEEHPLASFIRKLLPQECRYTTVEKECLALVAGIQTFRVYLEGTLFIAETELFAVPGPPRGDKWMPHPLEFGTSTLLLHFSTQSRIEKREC